ncbi:unnamed protein product [Lepeophtheirus salmonis]|uniref:(salmon louse) hypothetical protein n=1 Tax=Lepeophtheirus salmonis TaxID=72036 RepID=A0A7R8CWQ2_LEPSM|nr:unnamed protein product [Lepeophtheirus salmonis]CAF2923397.1 unnamed protein product [Lepeophtheirus salmonis]
MHQALNRRKHNIMIFRDFIHFLSPLLLSLPVLGFKTGLESGQICYQCVGTQPGCGLYDFDAKWQWDFMVIRDCLSNIEGLRLDIPADKYEGCRSASRDVKLGQYTFNRIKQLDVKRDYYQNVTWCFCDFDHWCNSALPSCQSFFGLVFLPLIL